MLLLRGRSCQPALFMEYKNKRWVKTAQPCKYIFFWHIMYRAWKDILLHVVRRVHAARPVTGTRHKLARNLAQQAHVLIVGHRWVSREHV